MSQMGRKDYRSMDGDSASHRRMQKRPLITSGKTENYTGSGEAIVYVTWCYGEFCSYSNYNPGMSWQTADPRAQYELGSRTIFQNQPR